jgi:hypothetical protein
LASYVWYGRHDFRRTCADCRTYHFDENGFPMRDAATGKYVKRESFGTRPPCEMAARLCPKVWLGIDTPPALERKTADIWIADFTGWWHDAFALFEDFRLFRQPEADPLKRAILRAMNIGFEAAQNARDEKIGFDTAKMIGREVITSFSKGVRNIY